MHFQNFPNNTLLGKYKRNWRRKRKGKTERKNYQKQTKRKCWISEYFMLLGSMVGTRDRQPPQSVCLYPESQVPPSTQAERGSFCKRLATFRTTQSPSNMATEPSKAPLSAVYQATLQVVVCHSERLIYIPLYSLLASFSASLSSRTLL